MAEECRGVQEQGGGGAADMQGWDSSRLEIASRLTSIIIFFKFRNGKFAYKGLI